MVALHPQKRKALLELLNCFALGSNLDSLSALKDGFYLFKLVQVMKLFAHQNNEALTSTERFKLIIGFLNDFFNIPLDSVISCKDCEEGVELELAKLLVLIISSVVQQSVSSSCSEIINAMVHLDNTVQEEIKQCLEAVIIDCENENISLNDKLAKVLSKKSKQTTTPRKHSCIDKTLVKNNTSSHRFTSRCTPTPSPLKVLLESPGMTQKMAKREYDREMSKIYTHLSIEQNKVMELENDIFLLRQSLTNKDKDISELRQRISDLRNYQDKEELNMEYKVAKQSYEQEIKSLHMKILKLEELRSRKEELQEENNSLLIHQRDLEQKVSLLETKLAQARLQAKKESEEEIHQLNNKCDTYQMEIVRLQGELQGVMREAGAMRQLYDENVTQLRHLQHSIEESPSRECLGSAVTDLRVHELETVLEEFKLLLEKQKTINENLEREKQELQNKLTTLHKRETDLEIELKSTNNKKEDREKALKAEIDNIQLEKQKLYECLDELRRTNFEFQGKLLQMTSDNRQHTFESQKEITHLQSIIEEKEETISNIQDRENKLQVDNHRLISRIDELSQENKSILLSCQKTEDTAKQYEQETCSLREQLQILNRAHHDKCQLLSEKLSLCDDLSNEKKALVSKVHFLEGKTSELEEVLEKETLQKTSLGQEAKQQLEENCALQQQIASHGKEIEMLTGVKNFVEERNTELIVKIENLVDKINTLENNTECLIKEKENLSEECKIYFDCSNQQKEQLKEIQQEKCELVNEKNLLVRDYEKHLKEDSKKIEHWKSMSLKFQKDMLLQKSEQYNVIKQLSNLSVKMSSLESHIDSLIKDKEKIYEQYKLNLDYINDLQELLNQSQSEKHVLAEQKDSLQIMYECHIKECNTEIEKLKSQALKYQDEILLNDLEQKKALDEWQKVNASLVSEIKQLKECIDNTKSEVDHFKNVCSSKEENMIKCLEDKSVLEEKLKIMELEFEEEKNIGKKKGKRLEEMEREQKNLQEHLKDIERELKSTLKAKEAVESDFELTEKDKEELITKINLLEEDIKERQLDGAEVEKLKVLIENIDKEKSDMTEKHLYEINLLKSELQKIGCEKDSLCESLTNKYQSEINNVEVQLQEKEMKNIEENERHQRDFQLLCNQKCTLESEIISLSSQVKNCEASLSKKEEIIMQKKKIIVQLGRELDMLKSQISEVEKFKEKNEQLLVEIRSLKEETHNILSEKQKIENSYEKKLCNVKENYSLNKEQNAKEIERLKVEVKSTIAKQKKLEEELMFKKAVFLDREKDFQMKKNNLEAEKQILEEKICSLYSELNAIKQNSKVEKEKIMLKCLEEMRQFKEEIKESSMKNITQQKSFCQEREILKKKYEAAKECINRLQFENNKLNNNSSSASAQIKRYQDEIKEATSKLNHANENIEQKCKMISSLHKQLEEAKEELASMEQNIRQKEYLLKSLTQQKQSLEVQLQMADKCIRDKKFVPREMTPVPNTKRRYSVSSSSDLKLGHGIHYVLSTDTLYEHAFSEKSYNKDDEDERTAKSLPFPLVPNYSTGTLKSMQSDYDFNGKESRNSLNSQLFSTTSLNISQSFPSTSDYFLSEDEVEDFTDHSHLNNLKNGKWELPKKNSRISELQRRNTLCLPHLQSSYPAEMLRHNIPSEDLNSRKGDGDAVTCRKMSSTNLSKEKCKPAHSPLRRKRQNSTTSNSGVQKRSKTSYVKDSSIKPAILSLKKSVEIFQPHTSSEQCNTKGFVRTHHNVKQCLQLYLTPKGSKKTERQRQDGKENMKHKFKQ